MGSLTTDKHNYLSSPLFYGKSEKYIPLYNNEDNERHENNNGKYFGIAELKYNRDPVVFSIEGYEFTLPSELKNISVAIEKSKYLLKLEEGWDEEEALPTTLETFLNSINFIVKYSTYIVKEFDGVIIEPPDVDILKDGSIAINWEMPLATFTIIFDREPCEFSFYYAKDKKNPIPLKYGIDINKSVDKYTALWMATNLKSNQETHSR